MSEKIIQSLYAAQLENSTSLSVIDKQMQNWLNQKPINFQELIGEDEWQNVYKKSEGSILVWKKLLTVNLLNFLSTSSHKLSQLVRQLELHPWNQSSQYFRVYVALNHFLTQLPIPEVGVHLLESGAALIDLKEYAPWFSMPYHPQHLEFGILLSLLASYLKRPDLEENVLRLATWQLNTLDSNYLPFPALYSSEKDNNYSEILILHYLLYRGVAFLTKKNQFAFLAQQLGKHVCERFESLKLKIDPLWVVLEQIFNFSSSDASLFNLSNQIYDSSTSLIGYRSLQQSAICTLHGCHTGLGYMRDEDIEILNYGPQYFPLDNCKGFGIEGNHLSDHGIRQSFMESSQSEFRIKGCVRLVDQPLGENAEKELFRGIWLEIAQEYKNHHLKIHTTLLGLDGWESVAFCFFVRVQKCVINSTRVFLPGKLDRYEGEIVPICLNGSHKELELSASSLEGTMQIIPLGGGNNFWGANFLIAYTLVSDQRSYDWFIRPLAKLEQI